MLNGKTFCNKATLKKRLFPVQRVPVIVARRAAANFILFLTHLFFVRKYCPYLEKIFGAKMKKEVPSRPFFGHMAAPPETKSYFSLALYT